MANILWSFVAALSAATEPRGSGWHGQVLMVGLAWATFRPDRPPTSHQMQRQVRAWAVLFLALGVFEVAAWAVAAARSPDAPLSLPASLLLAVIGAMGFLFPERAMFIVYGAIYAWAGVPDALAAPKPGAIILRLVICVFLIAQFSSFRRVAPDDDGRQTEMAAPQFLSSERIAPPLPSRAARVFPWLGPALGAVSLALTPTLLLAPVLPVFEAGSKLLIFLSSVAVLAGMLGFAVSLAALLAQFEPRSRSISGLIASSALLAFWLMTSLVGVGG